MIPRFDPCFNFNELKSLLSRSEDAVERFETEFARYMGFKHAISFPLGRSSLFSILKGLGISNKEVIIPSYTCMAVPSTIVFTDNIPVFAQVSLYDFNMHVDDVLNRVTNKTKVVIPTNTYGYPVNIKILRENLPEDVLIIDDLAQNLLIKKNRRHSDVQFYSFCSLKPFYTADGGLVTTDDSLIYDKIKLFRDKMFHPPSFKYNYRKARSALISLICFKTCFYKIYWLWYLAHLSNLYDENFDEPNKHVYKNFFQMLSSVQAKIGLSQIKKLPGNYEKRCKIAKYYDNGLRDLNETIITPSLLDGCSYSMYTILVKKRDEFIKFLWEKNIDVNKIYPYSVSYFSCFRKYVNQEYENSLKLSKEVVNLPIYPSLIDKPKKLDHIISCIRQYANKN